MEYLLKVKLLNLSENCFCQMQHHIQAGKLASGKQVWASGILYRLYKRLPSLGEYKKFLVSQPDIIKMWNLWN